VITMDDYVLAEVALLSSQTKSDAIRMLRDECGWTIRHAANVIELILAERGVLPARMLGGGK